MKAATQDTESAIHIRSVTVQVNSQDTRLDDVNSALEDAAEPFGVEPETWDDIFKGTIGGEVDFAVLSVPFLITGALYFSRGDVETDVMFLDPAAGAGEFYLRQQYTIITPEVGIKLPLPELGRLQTYLMLGISYVFLNAETDASVGFFSAPIFNMSFSDTDHPDGPGWYLGVAFDFRVSERWALYAVWRRNDIELTASDGTAIDLTAPAALGIGVTFLVGGIRTSLEDSDPGE